MPAAVVIEGLTRKHAGAERPALDALSLSVAEGEILVVVGPSGCGKSTALRLIAGLDTPDAGRVLIGGRDVTRAAPQDRDVAMVFQGYALYPHLTVRENIAFPLRMRGVSSADRKKRAEVVAATLSLSTLLERRPAELSGGERQRVAMGRAIIRSPRAFLFDEPLSNLDAALRAELRIELASIVRTLGTTSIYVTHDQVEAMTMGDRIAVMRSGSLQQLGTAREVYERPANKFVAGFVGTPPMNLVELTVSDGRARCVGLDLPPPAGRARDRVTAGIRPQHVHVATDGADFEGCVTLEATVSATEPLGAETYVYLDALSSKWTGRAPGFDAPPRGARVLARFDPKHLHWFDTDTGLRIDP